jgi:hypothetical protein
VSFILLRIEKNIELRQIFDPQIVSRETSAMKRVAITIHLRAWESRQVNLDPSLHLSKQLGKLVNAKESKANKR